ncbi:hypothetical protein L9F63_004363 [Diploptera punctata]|uniref:Peptidase S1 domain-containing protein n=1 Tax=Diploptera punctata TaxID=6984 RepID=A0AAD7ZG35_DIPPU|nr:hypothetical protein L9F63_004363 [Diploptera punctata]
MNSKADKDCECGQMGDKVENRIIGGEVIKPHLYPWMVAILRNGKLHCGGSIINDKYVLTAGHCIKWTRKNRLTVIMGMHDRIAMEKGTVKTSEIDKTIVHENFRSNYLHDTNDIGLIKLKKPIQYTDSIKPVCLPDPASDYTNLTGMITGWGRTAQNGKPSRYLRNAGVKIIPQEACKNTTVGEKITDTMLCAYEFGTDACQGDSGGPLLYEKLPGKVEQIGVVSWGIGCAEPGIPGVYTKMTEYVNWIKENTKDAEYCNN